MEGPVPFFLGKGCRRAAQGRRARRLRPISPSCRSYCGSRESLRGRRPMSVMMRVGRRGFTKQQSRGPCKPRLCLDLPTLGEKEEVRHEQRKSESALCRRAMLFRIVDNTTKTSPGESAAKLLNRDGATDCGTYLLARFFDPPFEKSRVPSERKF
jgi:hypothetical protein